MRFTFEPPKPLTLHQEFINTMKDLFFEVIAPIVCIFTIVIATCFAIALPIVWFEGHAKSEWLKQTRNVDIPWHRAAFLNMNINDIDADINSK